MSLNNSKPNYHYLDNHADHTWIILSGWATLGMFVVKPIKHSNMLFISDYNPYNLAETVDDWFKRYAITKFSIMGFSLGALWLSQSLNRFDQAKNIVFTGIRSSYTATQIATLKKGLEAGDASVLYSFWGNCKAFFKNEDPFLRAHTQFEWDYRCLLLGLQYLVTFSFEWPVSGTNITFFHGQLDRIAPLSELTLRENYDFRIIKRSGHICMPVLDDL
tara:strand:- start:11964 stop:12617 length:654 start_codon:yes stop_codon:yes gene_type:complete